MPAAKTFLGLVLRRGDGDARRPDDVVAGTPITPTLSAGSAFAEVRDADRTESAALEKTPSPGGPFHGLGSRPDGERGASSAFSFARRVVETVAKSGVLSI
jgi:hypothetical protein